MFEQVMAAGLEHDRRAWTALAGMGCQLSLVAAAVIAPLVSPQVLPRTQFLEKIVAPRPPAGRQPTAVRVVDVQRAPRPTQIVRGQLIAPRPEAIPARPVLIDEPPPVGVDTGAGLGLGGGVPGGVENGVPGGLAGLIAGQAAVPPALPAPVVAAPPPKPAVTQIQRIRVGGHVLAAKLIRQVVPVYPSLARQARVQGDVELLGVVGIDGQIRQLQVVSGHPLLVRSAVDAVRQWFYRPTFLNGEPVEVIAPITVYFRLNH
ncbi:MAG: energy transducer TonB [Bryobacteraceae bacterium]